MFMLWCRRGRGLTPLWNWRSAWLSRHPVNRGLGRHRVLDLLLHRRLKIWLMGEGPRGVDRGMVVHLHVWHRERLARLLGQGLTMRQVRTGM